MEFLETEAGGGGPMIGEVMEVEVGMGDAFTRLFVNETVVVTLAGESTSFSFCG